MARVCNYQVLDDIFTLRQTTEAYSATVNMLTS